MQVHKPLGNGFTHGVNILSNGTAIGKQIN
jgi:hypothetical protein